MYYGVELEEYFVVQSSTGGLRHTLNHTGFAGCSLLEQQVSQQRRCQGAPV